MEKRNLPDRYTDLRVEKGISQTELAKEFDCNKQYISLIESGDRDLSITMLERYADFFNVSTDYLLGRTDIKSTDTTMKSVCEYTGLNEDNVKMLNSAKEYENIEKNNLNLKFSCLDTINLLFTYIDYRGMFVFHLRDLLNIDLSNDEYDIRREISGKFPDFYNWFQDVYLSSPGFKRPFLVLSSIEYRNFLKNTALGLFDKIIQDIVAHNNPTDYERRKVLLLKEKYPADERFFTEVATTEVKE